MRSSTTAYALAAQFLPFVLAIPVAQVVEIVTEVDVVTAYTQVETYVDATTVDAAPVVTSVAPIEVPASSPTSAAATFSHFGHHNLHSAPSFTDGVPSAFSPVSFPDVPSTSIPPPVVVPTAAPTTVPAPPPAPTPVVPPTSIAIPTTLAAPAPPPPAYTPTTANTPAAAPIPSQAFSITGDSSFAPDMVKASTLNSTNFWRSMFDAPAATWNDSLVAPAQNLASSCNWGEDSAGQNIAMGDFSPQFLIDLFGVEYKTYNWASPGFSDTTGHFTQLVWKDSTSFACAANHCAESGGPSNAAHGWYLVCNYYPVGNMGGEYSQNVGALN